MPKHTCASCAWFSWDDQSYGYHRSSVYGEPGHTTGRCQRHAPTRDGFPPSKSTAWCGEHSALAAGPRPEGAP